MFTYLPQTMALFVLTPVVLETSKKWSPQGLTENQHHLWRYWNLSWTAAWYQNMFFHSFCFDPKTGRIWIFVPMVHTLFIRCKLEWSPTWIEGWHLAVTVECGTQPKKTCQSKYKYWSLWILWVRESKICEKVSIAPADPHTGETGIIESCWWTVLFCFWTNYSSSKLK